jgi:hypothetical protein
MISTRNSLTSPLLTASSLTEERRGDVRQLGADEVAQQVLKRASRDSKVAAGFF